MDERTATVNIGGQEYRGTKRNVESEPEGKNTAAG
mgnify:CR=1 FL=1